MTDPFVAEIRMFSGNFAPVGWALCNGQLLPIAQNTALFSLLGTTYGGDGRSTFALPNLQGSVPVQQGQGAGLSLYALGQTGGETAVTLLPSQLPSHSHLPMGVAANGDSGAPAGETWAESSFGKGMTSWYSTAAPNSTMSPQAVGQAGANLPHNNMPPYLCLTFIIALQGVYPPRS
jgi:microcystin-dependent protein